MKSDTLPSVLLAPNPANSISMERALKQAKELLEGYFANYGPTLPKEERERLEDQLQASIDDIDTMLAAIK